MIDLDTFRQLSTAREAGTLDPARAAAFDRQLAKGTFSGLQSQLASSPPVAPPAGYQAVPRVEPFTPATPEASPPASMADTATMTVPVPPQVRLQPPSRPDMGGGQYAPFAPPPTTRTEDQFAHRTTTSPLQGNLLFRTPGGEPLGVPSAPAPPPAQAADYPEPAPAPALPAAATTTTPTSPGRPQGGIPAKTLTKGMRREQLLDAGTVYPGEDLPGRLARGGERLAENLGLPPTEMPGTGPEEIITRFADAFRQAPQAFGDRPLSTLLQIAQTPSKVAQTAGDVLSNKKIVGKAAEVGTDLYLGGKVLNRAYSPAAPARKITQLTEGTLTPALERAGATTARVLRATPRTGLTGIEETARVATQSVGRDITAAMRATNDATRLRLLQRALAAAERAGIAGSPELTALRPLVERLGSLSSSLGRRQAVRAGVRRVGRAGAQLTGLGILSSMLGRD